jgi:hypothetical protein
MDKIKLKRCARYVWMICQRNKKLFNFYVTGVIFFIKILHFFILKCWKWGRDQNSIFYNLYKLLKVLFLVFCLFNLLRIKLGSRFFKLIVNLWLILLNVIFLLKFIDCIWGNFLTCIYFHKVIYLKIFKNI